MQTPAQPGYYVPTSGATVEIPAGLGNYVPTTTASSETLASAGYYVPVTGASAETPSPAGSYISVSGATSESQAVLAPAGSYSPSGSSAAIEFAAGTYYPDAGASNSAQALEADPGYYVPDSGSSYETAASPGHYVPTAGATTEYVAQMGDYVPTTAATAAIAASPGYYVNTTGATAQIPAPAGTFVPNTGTTTPLLASLGHYVPTSGATAQLLASPGSYVSAIGASVATLASPGYYVSTTGASAETSAQPGYYVPVSGMTAPIIAPSGYYVAASAAITAMPDPAGTFSLAGATAPTPLTLNTINLTYGQELNASQINGNIPVAGTWSFASSQSAMIAAGMGQEEAVEFTGSDASTLAPVTGAVTVNVARAVPAVTISDQGGVYTDGAFAATALVSGLNGNSSESLEGVSPVVEYYAGTAATGTPLAGPPSAIGTYTASAIFPGSADYTAASNTITFSILSNADKLVFAGLAATTTAGHRIAVFKVYLENSSGQLLSSGADASASVTITGFPGKAFSTRALHGVATFKTVQTKVAGSYTLTASISDKAVATTTASETVVPAVPAKLVLLSSRSVQGEAGVPLATPVSFGLEDKFGNLEVSSSASTVTLFSKSTIAPTGWSGNSAALQQGIATFDDLLIDQSGVYTLFAKDANAGIVSTSLTTIDLSTTPD